MGKLNVLCGNILYYLDGMDAIVNSNNKYMVEGSGVSGLIYKAAGKDILEKYCKNKYKKWMTVNEVRITPGFDLNIDIIHIYSPKAYKSQEPLKELLEGYENIFIKAKEQGYKNIISPSLGTNIHGYDHDEIGKELVKKLEELVKKYDINFTLFLLNKEIEEIYLKYIKK